MEKVVQIQKRIKELFDKDQELLFANKVEEFKEFNKNASEEVKKIIEQYGFISIEEYGLDTFTRTCVLVQHIPESKENIVFRENFLHLMEENFPSQDAPLKIKQRFYEYYALITDRMLMHEGKNQLYGTQLDIDSTTGESILDPKLNLKEVNQRRKEIYLIPLDKYLESNKETFKNKSQKAEINFMTDIEISEKINLQYQIDQDCRNNPNSSVEEMVKIDENTYQLMERIVSHIGAITISRFGKDVSSKAWLLVQHCDYHVDFQQFYLDLMLKNPNEFSKTDIAYLVDRVALNTSRPQVYATQFVRQANGKYVPHETIDPENVDKRRLEIGLSTLKEYSKHSPNWDVTEYYRNSQNH